MELLNEFIETNDSVEILKLTKVKPANFNFMAALAINEETKLRELSLEIFKINDQTIDQQSVLPPTFFD